MSSEENMEVHKYIIWTSVGIGVAFALGFLGSAIFDGISFLI